MISRRSVLASMFASLVPTYFRKVKAQEVNVSQDQEFESDYNYVLNPDQEESECIDGVTCRLSCDKFRAWLSVHIDIRKLLASEKREISLKKFRHDHHWTGFFKWLEIRDDAIHFEKPFQAGEGMPQNDHLGSVVKFHKLSNMECGIMLTDRGASYLILKLKNQASRLFAWSHQGWMRVYHESKELYCMDRYPTGAGYQMRLVNQQEFLRHLDEAKGPRSDDVS